MTESEKDPKIKIGVSSCLLGENVRWDGNHKREAYLTDILGQYVEWVPVCPELEIGMGVPRETVQLVGPDNPRMLGTRSKKDWTNPMLNFAAKKIKELDQLELSGFILKKGSPSCGINNVVLRTAKNMPAGRGSGLFAQRLIQHFPWLPVEDEGRLNDPNIRENFIIRLFAFNRLRKLFKSSWKPKDLIQFHTAHKYLLLAHSQKHYRQLGVLVSDLKHIARGDLQNRYQQLFMEAFSYRTTRRKNLNVLQHMHGFFRDILSEDDRADALNAIRDYEKGYVPLIVPVTLIKHFVRKFNIEFLADQVYLNPHPKELMLRNHV